MECEKDKGEMKKENAKLQQEILDLKSKLKLQDDQLNQRKHDIKEVQEQFGAIILREMKWKEKELREEFATYEKELHKEFASNLGIQIQKKEDEINRVYEEVDALKMKNVEWIMAQSVLYEKIDKVERDNQKLNNNNKIFLQQNIKLQNEVTQLQYELSHLKRAYSDLYLARGLNAKVHNPNDLKNIPSPQDLQKKFKNFINQQNNAQLQATLMVNGDSPTPKPPVNPEPHNSD